MGKKSTRDNKSIYQISREEAGMTREEASEVMQFVSDSRIEKYETRKSPVQPEEVMAMAKAYKKPMLATMNSLEKAKDRFIEITADGKISEDEFADFAKIEKGVEEISMAADSLSLWVNNTIASGKIDEEKLEAARKALGI